MTPLFVIITVMAYFAVLFTVSFLAGRNSDNQGFFVGNRKSPWYVVAVATIGAMISGVTFVSVPGMVAANGFSYLQMVLGFAVGQILIAFVLIPLFYKMNLVSIYQYLENRFGITTHKTGAWFFFVSKMLGAAIRLFIVCVVFQLLIFEPLGMHFIFNLVFTMAIVWLYTFKGGVKSLIWTDSFKTLCLIVSGGLCVYYISVNLGGNPFKIISGSDMSKTFFFDDINDKRYFFKQFLAGIFTMIATSGLDQDLMQRSLSCKNHRDSQKNLITGSVLMVFVNLLFLMMGVLLYTFAARNNIALPGKPDEVFPFLATRNFFPVTVSILFIIGLVSAAYAAAGSALTALTTSFTVDILESSKRNSEHKTASIRKRVHLGMALIMAIVIFIINIFNNASVIDTVYKLASYTYGPLLGMFLFGIFLKRKVKDRAVPWIAIASPALCFIFDINSKAWFNGYEFSHERLILNALFTFTGLLIISRK
ncbi:MAG: sodium:solute symporter [Tannerella sp.]|jgi:SSS family transporter|nr:sodium:solute symporter [Tannerella sp.]